MKGLLRKDFYMAAKYCRSYLLIGIVFLAVSFTGEDRQHLFFLFYPCLLCGMVPVNLLAYDERSRWTQYSGALPYTKAQLVSGKYLVGAIIQGGMFLAVGIAQAVRMNLAGGFRLGEYALFMVSFFAVAAVASSICLPFVFRWGVEKGRIAYYCMIVLACAGGYAASALFDSGIRLAVSQGLLSTILCLAGAGVYAVSWLASIALYRRREIA